MIDLVIDLHVLNLGDLILLLVIRVFLVVVCWPSALRLANGS